MRSRASNSSLTYPVISCESVKTFRLSISSSLAIFKPTRRASYSAWLFKILKLNRRTYSVIIPSKLMRMRPALLSCALNTPSTCSTHTNIKSASEVSICFLLSSSSLRLSSDMVHSMIVPSLMVVSDIEYQIH